MSRRGGRGRSRGLLRLIDADAIAIVVLRFVQRLIDRGEQAREREDVAVGAAFGDADAEGRLLAEVRDRVREIDRRECLPKLLHDLLRLRDARLWQRDDELVAAVSKR